MDNCSALKMREIMTQVTHGWTTKASNETSQSKSKKKQNNNKSKKQKPTLLDTSN